MSISPGVALDAAIVACGHALLPTIAAFIVIPVMLSVSTQGTDDVSQRLLEAFALSLGVRVAMQLFSTAVELCALFVVCLCTTEACRQWNNRVSRCAYGWLHKRICWLMPNAPDTVQVAPVSDLRRWVDLQTMKRE
jgi:hypothetical protein